MTDEAAQRARRASEAARSRRWRAPTEVVTRAGGLPNLPNYPRFFGGFSRYMGNFFVLKNLDT